MPTPTDYERIAPRYDDARGGPRERLDGWRIALSPFLDRTGFPVLDVGCGTGWWAAALAQWFNVRVVAVEPFEAMLREALKKRRVSRVSYLGGRAERLPLRDGSGGNVWLSTVVHHVSDLGACAAELRRVLAPGGRVLIRNAFSGRTDGIPWLRHFEHVRRVAEGRWPTVDHVLEAFAPAGFRLEHLAPVAEISAPSLASYARRVGLRADSTLVAISDEDFEQGMRSLERAAAAELAPRRVVTTLDLLILKTIG